MVSQRFCFSHERSDENRILCSSKRYRIAVIIDRELQVIGHTNPVRALGKSGGFADS